jgi:hypothetical protein
MLAAKFIGVEWLHKLNFVLLAIHLFTARSDHILNNIGIIASLAYYGDKQCLHLISFLK